MTHGLLSSLKSVGIVAARCVNVGSTGVTTSKSTSASGGSYSSSDDKVRFRPIVTAFSFFDSLSTDD
jgi:hypothetical protein